VQGDLFPACHRIQKVVTGLLFEEIMNMKSGIRLILAVAVVSLAAACKREPAPPPPPTTPSGVISNAAAQTGAAIRSAADQAAQQAGRAATQAVGAVQQGAAAALQAVTNAVPQAAQVQSAIGAATQLVTQGKYQEALQSLGSLATVKLTPEQQKTVDALKQQINAALAKGTSAAGAAAGAITNAIPALPR